MDKSISTPDELNKAVEAVYSNFKGKMDLVPVAGSDNTPSVFKVKATESEDNRKLRYGLMKAALDNPIPLNELRKGGGGISTSANVYGYDLRAPSLHLIPFLSPLRDSTSRVTHSQPGTAANWKTIWASSLTVQGFKADPWTNEGQRGQTFTFSAQTITAPYTTIGLDGNDTYEAQSAGRDFEDPLASARFIGLENLFVMEEDALLGGNKSVKVGTANTPVGSSSTSSVIGFSSITGALSGTYYFAVVGLTYSGYRNQSASAGLVQQATVTTPDGKTFTVNGGTGIYSTVSSASSASSMNLTVAQKHGEFAWAWYVGTASSTSSLKLQGITTAPNYLFGSITSSGQTLSSLSATDYSVNDGTTGGASNQVTAFDGFLSQILVAASSGSSSNTYVSFLAGAALTASGRGSIEEIDTALKYAWDNYRVTYDRIYVNSQELMNITNKVLSNASGPLVRYEVDGNGGNYNLTAAGTISFYYNPFVNGGSKIPIIVHPTIPPGTIMLQGLTLPAYYKKSNMQTTAEVIARRDYYGVDWADTTRTYQFGTYSEEVLAMYAPFSYGIITGIGNN